MLLPAATLAFAPTRGCAAPEEPVLQRVAMDKTQADDVNMDRIAIPHAPDEVDFGSIMELMTSKYTVDLVDRHVAAIRKLCKVCCNGFLLQHLEALVDLLYLAVDRFAQGQDLLAQALCDFTRVASQPFVSCKTSDMITYGHHLPAFVKGIVSVLSYALPPDNPPSDPEAKASWEQKKMMSERLRVEVAHTLACWARFGLDEET